MALCGFVVPSGNAPCAEADAVPSILRVATSGDYAPFSHITPSADDADRKAGGRDPQKKSARPENSAPRIGNVSNDGLAGFDIDVALLFAADHDAKVQFVRFRWPDLTAMLAAGNFDIAMSGITERPERSVKGRFSVPVAATQAVALTWKGSGFTTIKDLNRPGRRIVVNAGGHLEKVARCVFDRAIILPIADNDAVHMAMLDRAYDAVVTDSLEETSWAASAEGVVRIGPLSEDRKAYLLPANDGALVAALDRWLLAKEKDGTLAKLRVRHFLGNAPRATTPTAGENAAQPGSPLAATAEPLAALADAINERLSLMPFVYEAKKQTQSPIEDKEREAQVLTLATRATSLAASEAGVAQPNPDAVREVFEALMGMGRDAQQQLTDEETKQRAGLAEKTAAANAPPGDKAASVEGTSAAVSPSAAAPPTPDNPTFDLATEIRPAIGRITEKIARILVSIEANISETEAHRALSHSLKPPSVSPQRLNELATAISHLSAPANPKP